jgi:hypothetical protein
MATSSADGCAEPIVMTLAFFRTVSARIAQ